LSEQIVFGVADALHGFDLDHRHDPPVRCFEEDSYKTLQSDRIRYPTERLNYSEVSRAMLLVQPDEIKTSHPDKFDDDGRQRPAYDADWHCTSSELFLDAIAVGQHFRDCLCRQYCFR
jgi:hypothetical protein